MRILRGGKTVCDAPVESITCPVLLDREARPAPAPPEGVFSWDGDAAEALLAMLASPNGGSAEPLFRSYDTEVQGRAVIRPGEADASVILPIPGCPVGLAATVDGNPWYGRLDPRAAGALAVAEGARNLAAVGARPLGMTDCLNYGNPEDPEVYHQFLEGVRGIREGGGGDRPRRGSRLPHPDRERERQLLQRIVPGERGRAFADSLHSRDRCMTHPGR